MYVFNTTKQFVKDDGNPPNDDLNLIVKSSYDENDFCKQTKIHIPEEEDNER